MSFDNNLLTEVKGIEYVVGLGIDLRMWFSSRLADNPSGIIRGYQYESWLSYRNNQTIVRGI
jgi:hypothetical protein